MFQVYYFLSWVREGNCFGFGDVFCLFVNGIVLGFVFLISLRAAERSRSRCFLFISSFSLLVN